VEGDPAVTNEAALLELAAEISTIAGTTLRDWAITPVADLGWVMGARRTRGAFNIAVDKVGNFFTYHLLSPEMAMAELTRLVGHTQPATAAAQPAESEFLRLDRLNWTFAFRRPAGSTEVEVWSMADQCWRPTALLELTGDAEGSLIAADLDLAEQWIARKAPGAAASPAIRYFLTQPAPVAALWLSPGTDGTPRWRQYVAAEGRFVPLTDEELAQLRDGRELREVPEPDFEQALAVLRAAQ
jgi:hypothetical protein